MNKIVKILSIVLLALLVAFEFVLLTDSISDQRKYIKRLEDRVKQLEIDYKLYQYDLESLQEYNY